MAVSNLMTPGSHKELRVALIGFGLGGACFHAPLIAATAGMTLATVVTANAERRAQALRDYPGVQVVADPDTLWKSAADHDLVVISTPNRSHVKLALAALSAGLAVVIDKPFAPTAAEARQVIAAARAKKLADQRLSYQALGQRKPDPARFAGTRSAGPRAAF